MTKHWLAGAAAFAMMTGVALAQSDSSDTRTSTQSNTTTNNPSAPGSYNASKVQKTTDGDGDKTVHSQTYKSNADGTSAASSTRTRTDDGSRESTSHEERTNAPVDDTTTTDKTSTTTTDH
jgi:hypothetical protein